MTFAQLAHKLLAHKEPLLRREWPQELNVPTDSEGGFLGFNSKNIFWERIYNLRNYTDDWAHKFSERHEGSTGWEYEISLAYVNGNFYYTTAASSRDYDQVSAGHSLKIDSNFNEKNLYLVDKVLIDDKYVGSITFSGKQQLLERKKMIEDKKYVLGFVARFHSHPQVQVAGLDKRIYTFFSPQDIRALMGGGSPLLGLVSDRLWLIGKTSESVKLLSDPEAFASLSKDLHMITQLEAQGNTEIMVEQAGNMLSRYELICYTAEFGRYQLERIA